MIYVYKTQDIASCKTLHDNWNRFIVMTIGIHEKLASEKVTATTWNIGPDLRAFWQRFCLFVDCLDYCNYFVVFKYGLLY